MNQNPEQIARDRINEMLRKARGEVGSKKSVDLRSAKTVALREINTITALTDFFLFTNTKPVEKPI